MFRSILVTERLTSIILSVAAFLAVFLFISVSPVSAASTTTQTIIASDDTYSTTFAPGVQKGDQNWIRVQDVNKQTHKYKHMHRGFVQFDLSVLPVDADLATATARLYVSQVSKDGPVDVQLVTEVWDETTVTMNAVPDVSFEVIETLNVTAGNVGAFIEFDLTAEIINWLAGSTTNAGIMLSPRGTAVEFGTKESSVDLSQAAQLVITTIEEVEPEPEQRPFIITAPLVNEGDTFFLGTDSSLSYNYTVDWGDGTVTQETGDAAHTYGPGIPSGDVPISITGDFPAFQMNNYLAPGEPNGDAFIGELIQWGDIEWQSLERFSNNGDNPDSWYLATDTPDTSNVTNLRYLFNGDDEDFPGANGPIIDSLQNWDVSSVVDMEGALYRVGESTDLSGWDVGAVQNMDYLFFESYEDDWNIGSWDTSSAVSMNFMFNNSGGESYPIGSWDISNVQSMIGMLDQVFMPVDNYDAILNGWAAQAPNIQSNVTFGADGLEYSSAASSSRALLVNTYGWNIVGDSYAGF